jgi:mono/diheme cytochrome c family protein
MNRGILVGIIVSLVVIGGGVSAVLLKDPLVSEGKATYGYYCAHCHGMKGQGNGFNADNLDPKPRDHTDGAESYMAGRTNEELVEAVTMGGKGIGKSPFMPPFGAVLSEKEIWSLVAYMRTLHKNDAPKVVLPAEVKAERPKMPASRLKQLELPEKFDENGAPVDPETVKAELAQQGEGLFNRKYGCSGCHAIDGVGGKVGPPLSRAGFRLRPAYIYNWIKNPQSIKPDTKMPNFQLRDRDALAITYYLMTLNAAPEGPSDGAASGNKGA